MVYFYGQITEPILCTLKYLLTACIWQRLFQLARASVEDIRVAQEWH